MKLLFRPLQVIRPAKFFWPIAVLALVLILLFLPRSPLPWLDEIYYASASLAVVRGGPSVPAVMGAFPHTGRIDMLYGPLISFLGSLEIRLLGLSATSWRLLGFWGAVGAVFSAAWVSRRLDRSPGAAAAAAMFVALSQGMGARATSGRLDTVTVALELFCLACTLGAVQLQRPRRSSLIYAALAGGFCGLAALSTPRSFPFVLGLFVALGLELVLARNRELLTRSVVIGVAALLPVWAWTFTQGMNPLSWLRFIGTASQGDKINVSPLLHGTWHVFDGPRIPLVSGLLVILVTLLVLAATVAANLSAQRAPETKESGFNSGVRPAAITVLISYFALFVTISRFWDYEIFVVPLILPILTASTAKILRRREPVILILQRLVLVSWLILAIFLTAIRAGKVAAWAASYRERAPQPLQDFVGERVPAGSRVFGPEDYYFYAVEGAGSHYLFVHPIVPTALLSKLDHKIVWQEQLATGQDAYLIWPSDEALPQGLTSSNLTLLGSFTESRGGVASGWRKAGWVSGYPPTSLYRVVEPAAAQKAPL